MHYCYILYCLPIAVSVNSFQRKFVCDLLFLLWSIEFLKSDPQNIPFSVIFQ